MLRTCLQGSATPLPCLVRRVKAGAIPKIKAYAGAHNEHAYKQHIARHAAQERIAFLPETCYNHTVKL